MGGALSFANSRPEEVGTSLVQDCIFIGNNATDGGAIDVNSQETTVEVRTSLFDDNHARGSGGAISVSNTGIVIVEDSNMTGNAAGENGGSVYASAGKVTLRRVTVADSLAGDAGGGVSVNGVESTGAFYACIWARCNATRGGGLAASNDVPELTIQGGAFSQCHAGESGGAVRVAGSGSFQVDATAFDDCSVGYSAEDACLTLTMVQSAGIGWQGSELFVFREEDYQIESRYDCPTTCAFQGAVFSCDW